MLPSGRRGPTSRSGTCRTCPRRPRLSEVTKSVEWMTTLIPTACLLGLEELREAKPHGAGRHHQVDGRGRDPRRCDELLRLASGCTAVHLIARVEPGARRRDRRAAGQHGAAEDDLVHRRCGRSPSRTPRAGCELDAIGVPTFEYGSFPSAVLVADVEREPLVAERRLLDDPRGSVVCSIARSCVESIRRAPAGRRPSARQRLLRRRSRP